MLLDIKRKKEKNKKKQTLQPSRITFRRIGLHLPLEYKRSKDTNRKSNERQQGNTKIDKVPQRDK